MSKYVYMDLSAIRVGDVVAYSEMPFDDYADSIGFINDSMMYQPIVFRACDGFMCDIEDANLVGLEYHAFKTNEDGVDFIDDLTKLDVLKSNVTIEFATNYFEVINNV